MMAHRMRSIRRLLKFINKRNLLALTGQHKDSGKIQAKTKLDIVMRENK